MWRGSNFKLIRLVLYNAVASAVTYSKAISETSSADYVRRDRRGRMGTALIATIT